MSGSRTIPLAKTPACVAPRAKSATPDYCEMNVVANSTGMAPVGDALSYRLCRIIELAEEFIPSRMEAF